MSTITINFDEVEGAQDLIPEGKYLARAKKAEIRNSKSSGQPYVNVTYAIANDGEFYGRIAWAMLSLSPAALWRTKPAFAAHGFEGAVDIQTDEVDNTVLEPDFTDKLVCITIKHDEYNGKVTAKIDAIEPEDAYEEMAF